MMIQKKLIGFHGASAVFVRQLKSGKGDRRLYRLSAPFPFMHREQGVSTTEWLIATTARNQSTGSVDIAVFAGNAEGSIISFIGLTEIENESDHAKALAALNVHLLAAKE